MYNKTLSKIQISCLTVKFGKNFKKKLTINIKDGIINGLLAECHAIIRKKPNDRHNDTGGKK